MLRNEIKDRRRIGRHYGHLKKTKGNIKTDTQSVLQQVQKRMQSV